VANYNQHGGRSVALPSENRPSWSPQEQAQSLTHRDQDNDNDEDHDYRSWRDRNERDNDRPTRELDPRRWEGGRGSELGYGERGADYYGEARSQYVAHRNERYPSPGSFEDRNHDIGGDRFSGEGRATYERMGSQPGSIHRAEPISYRGGAYGRGYGHGSGTYGPGEDSSQRSAASYPHVHRGTGPHRGKGPFGYRRSDERIHELVCESLADDDQLDASQIEVLVHNGEVTLSGTVEDRQAKRDAEDCACSVTGVRDVQNLLRVSGEVASQRTSLRGASSSEPPEEANEPESFSQDKRYRS
jgi:hypothetical protein